MGKTQILLIPLFCFALNVSAQKDDTLRLDNGDRITGELKRLEYGMLQFKTSDMGTLNIEWERVKSIQTKKFFEIFLEDNSKYFGRIDSSFTESNRIKLLMQMEGTDRYLDLIVKFVPIKQRIKDRIDIDVELGFQYTKGSDVLNFNTGYRFFYRNLRDEISLTGSNYITNQRREQQDFRKQDVNLSYNRFLKKSWKIGAFTTLEQNTELGLQLRTTLGLSTGKVAIQSLHSDLEFVVGLLGNQETSTDQVSTNNLEVKLQTNFRYFIFHNPELSINTDATIYPSLNVEGRVRAVVNVKAKIEVMKDFFFNLTFYDNFDSKPLTADASNNDFGITTSISYSF